MKRSIFCKILRSASIFLFLAFCDFVLCADEHSMDMNYTGVSDNAICCTLTPDEVEDVLYATISNCEAKALTPDELESVYTDIMYSMHPHLGGESFEITESKELVEDINKPGKISVSPPQSDSIPVQESLESKLERAKSNMGSPRVTIVESPIVKLIGWIDKSEQFFAENNVDPEDPRALRAFHVRWHDEKGLRKRAKKLLGKQGRKWFEKQLCAAAVTARQMINEEVAKAEEQRRQEEEKEKQKKEILNQLELALEKKQQEKLEKARLKQEEKLRIEREKRALFEKREAWYASQVEQVKEKSENLEGEIEEFCKTKKYVERIKDRRTRDGGSVRRKLICVALCQIKCCEDELASEEYERFYVAKTRLMPVVETINQGARFKQKTYEISDELREHADSWGFRLDSLESMHANSVQHYIYQRAVSALNETARIKSAFYDVGDIAKTTDVVACSLDYAIECAQEHEYKKSFDLIDLASGAFEVAKGAARGFFYLAGRVMQGMERGGKEISECFSNTNEPVSFPEAVENHSREVLNASRDFWDSISDFLTRAREQPIIESVGDSLEFLLRQLTKVAIVGGIVIGMSVAIEAGMAIAASVPSMAAMKELVEPFAVGVARDGSVVLEKVSSPVVSVRQAVATPLAQALEKLYGFSNAINHFLFAAQGGGGTSYGGFCRTHSICGRMSSKNVKDIYEGMLKDGWIGEPIKVADINGEKYLLDGHHRFYAARKAGITVKYDIVPRANWCDYGYNSADEIVWAASEVSTDKIRF